MEQIILRANNVEVWTSDVVVSFEFWGFLAIDSWCQRRVTE
jgi:hypothetical protein